MTNALAILSVGDIPQSYKDCMIFKYVNTQQFLIHPMSEYFSQRPLSIEHIWRTTFFLNPHYICMSYTSIKSIENSQIWWVKHLSKMEAGTTMVFIFKNAFQMIKLFTNICTRLKQERPLITQFEANIFSLDLFVISCFIHRACRAHPVNTILVKILH